TDIVGDEQIDPRERQRLAQGLELISIDADPRTERGLEERRIGGGDAVPATGIQVGGEDLRLVEAFDPNLGPFVAFQDPRVGLMLPQDRQLLPLGVIIDASEIDHMRVASRRRRLNALDDPPSLTYVDDCTWVKKESCHSKRDASRSANMQFPF